MAKLPFMKFFPADYLLDTQILTAPTRGIWMDLICLLWRSDTRGELTYPLIVWLPLLRVSEYEFTHAINELSQHNICIIVTGSHNNVTIKSRRILKEEKVRNGARIRQSRHRVTAGCHATVTPEKLEARSQKLDIRSQISDVRHQKREKKNKSSQGVADATALAPSKSSDCWTSYARRYEQRYGTVPVRNATVNAMLCKLVDKLGAVEAPQVAGFFLTHNAPFYVAKMHPVNLLVADAEKLRTEWITGAKMTTGAVRNAETRDDMLEQLKRVNALLHTPIKEVNP